jgi:hypothetical protein
MDESHVVLVEHQALGLGFTVNAPPPCGAS